MRRTRAWPKPRLPPAMVPGPLRRWRGLMMLQNPLLRLEPALLPTLSARQEAALRAPEGPHDAPPPALRLLPVCHHSPFPSLLRRPPKSRIRIRTVRSVQSTSTVPLALRDGVISTPKRGVGLSQRPLTTPPTQAPTPFLRQTPKRAATPRLRRATLSSSWRLRKIATIQCCCRSWLVFMSTAVGTRAR